MGWSGVIFMVLSFCAASIVVAMSEKFCGTTFFISRSSMFSSVDATMPNTVVPTLASKADLRVIDEHFAACCNLLTHGRHFCLSAPSYTSMFSKYAFQFSFSLLLHSHSSICVIRSFAHSLFADGAGDSCVVWLGATC